MSNQSSIIVTSHVSRDFLQNSAYFNTLSKIVWEYIANSLDASKEGVLAVVATEITSNFITISDNGRGMSREELNNFFQMHGENIQKKRGRKVRGRFGTGKCAAFGLANYLRIDTTQSGKRNVVELLRGEIEDAKSGNPFPVTDVVVDGSTEDEDGTIVHIKNFNVKRPNVDRVISYIERHLSRYHQRAYVTVNGHECKFKEPEFVSEYNISPPDDVKKHIGNVELCIRISPIPLDDDVKGIDILSHGIWHETTLAGLEKKDRVNYIFGQIDIPILEDGEWKIPAFDNTRNNTLNRSNPVVAVLLGWLSEELEEVRLQLVEKERERRKSEEAKHLAKEAEKIAEILNDDFAQVELELELSRSVSKRSGRKSVDEILDEHGDLWPGGGDQPTPWEQTGSPHGDGSRGSLAGEGEEPRPGPSVQPGSEPGAKKKSSKGHKKRRRAVFSIEYENATNKNPRSRYEGVSKTIFINLDHAQIASAYEAGGKRIEARHFREICYEVAAVEYSLAIPYEKLEKDEFYHASDALFDVRDTINRVTKRFMQILH